MCFKPPVVTQHRRPFGYAVASQLAGWLLAAALLGGCSSVSRPYVPANEPPAIQLGRSQMRVQNDVTVQVFIPTEVEAASFFGVPLARHDIQPIHLRIENRSGTDYWLMPIAIDPDYYSADEAALVTGGHLNAEDEKRNRARFRAHALPFFMPAGSVHEGYVYASHKIGGRFIDVRLSGHQRAVRMRFAILLPTEAFDYESSALRERYAAIDRLPDLPEDALREALRALPCCTANEDNSEPGDPLNIVLIGHAEDVIAALTASDWDFTEAITMDSILEMIGAAIAEKSFIYAPISKLYLFDRPQDIAMQRGRPSINQRNHMRLWLAPFRAQGLPVWVGQVSRDIGVKVTVRSPTLTTHVIDPVVDEAREYLMHSLLHRGAVSRFAFVRGVGRSESNAPRENLTGDPYITDGMRMVLWISRDPVDAHMAEDLGWNASADPIRESQGGEHMIPALNQ